jgi:heme exporter protein A
VNLLALSDVSCIRGGRLLFERLSLTLGAGEAAVVTGPNGAGKSSLIRVAAGLLRVSVGTVERGGAAALADDGLALDQKLSLGRALGFWAAMDGAATERGMEALGLKGLAHVPVGMLSTGQRKRATLARVAASGAPLWLLDEPLNGLDEEGAERLAAVMADHRRAGGAILVATHQPIHLPDAAEVRLG